MQYDAPYKINYDQLPEEQALAHDRAHKDRNEYNVTVSVYSNGMIERIVYHNKEDQRHRKDGPALVEWFEDGSLATVSYIVDSLLHRDPIDGPAMVYYNKDGTISFEKNFWRGKEEWEKDKWIGYPPPAPDNYDSNGLGRIFR